MNNVPSTPVSASEVSSNIPRTPSSSTRRSAQSYPAMTHFIAFTVFATPIALVPYYLSRRSVGSLRSSLARFSQTTAALQHELRLIHDENRKLRTTLQELTKQIDELSVDCVAREHGRSSADIKTQENILSLAKTCRMQNDTIRSLGAPFSEVASFMQEMQLRLGVESDEGRISRLRTFALMLDKLKQSKTRQSD